VKTAAPAQAAPVPAAAPRPAPQDAQHRRASDHRGSVVRKAPAARPAREQRPAAPAAAVASPAARTESTPVAPAKPATVVSENHEAISFDSTQTIRALTSLELAADEASAWFVIQLTASESPIESEHVPNLDIFDEYRLYCVTGLDQDRVMHALRLGFFSSQIAAQAVSGYLASYFESPSVKRVSIAERDRFAERRVKASKDIGESGNHSVIELSAPAPLPERRAPEAGEGAKDPGESSLWSRLISPLKR